MYICLEGIKGAGKTATYAIVKSTLEELHIPFATICPTKPISGFDLRENLNSKLELLRNSTLWARWIYSHRSNLSAKRALREKKSLILGDRSKLTSYVVRRMQGKSWDESVTIIDRIEKYIPIPDIVIYFNIDPAIAYERVKNRNDKFKIRKDETRDALIRSRDLYEELKNSNIVDKLNGIRWIELDGLSSPVYNAGYIMDIILNHK